MRMTLSALSVAVLVSGCATAPSGYMPVVDLRQDQTVEDLNRDLSQCRVLAMQRANAAQGAVAGAIVGALLGALLAPKGYRSYTASRAAAVGAAGGAGQAEEKQEWVIARCLSLRGYNVLD